ncbi:hypothetical protein JTF08_04420 [Micrococcaceae bacterium RIT802]|nr:hypothetical protein [Micrococcaceae bacterium RIT 802]
MGLPRAGRPVEQHPALQVLAGPPHGVAAQAEVDDLLLDLPQEPRWEDEVLGP